MSVAPRPSPERPRLITRRLSLRDEEELSVGAVIVTPVDGQPSAYSFAPPGDPDDAHAGTVQLEQSFVAVLAPSCDTAMTLLLNQPPGTYLLVKEEDSAIRVYVKFQQAVRAVTLVKGKEMKKQEENLQLGKVHSRNSKTNDIFVQTPVHTLRLSMDSYLIMEHCWTRFLPQVQAVVFELCCESQLDEEIRLENWVPPMGLTSYSFALMPEACGFYIFTIPESTEATTNVTQVRQVEFDFTKFVFAMADGTLKPAALFLSTYFSTKRTFEPEITFSTIRDNFLFPDQVFLKETTVNTVPSHQLPVHNYIDLGSNDEELALLCAVDAACGGIMPQKDLPETFLNALRDMHVYFARASFGVAEGGVVTPSAKPTPWSAQKMKLVGRIIPILLELLIVSAGFSEPNDSGERTDPLAAAAEAKKKKLFAQFASAMRFDLLFLFARSDASVICRATHHISQLLGAKIRLPGEFIELIRDLVALFPIFLRLFLRNHGPITLWRNLHQRDFDKDPTFDPKGKSFRSLLTASSSAMTAHQGGRERKTSFFGIGRKPPTKSRKSLSLGVSFTTTSFLSAKALAFFRLSPLLVQLDLGMQLRDGQFVFPDVWKDDPVLAGIAFCCCNTKAFYEHSRHSKDKPGVCARKAARSSPKHTTYELLLQLSSRFLYHKSSFSNWDRDVALLFRLEELYQHLFKDIIAIARKRLQAQYSTKGKELSCELGVVITCISTLYRLELKRRREMPAALGDKKYLSLVQCFKTHLREFNRRMKQGDQTKVVEEEEGEKVDFDADDVLLFAMTELFQRIPKSFLNEWIVISLKEILQVLNELSTLVKQTNVSSSKMLWHFDQILSLITVMLKRTSDSDIQTILMRVLSGECSSITSILRFALSPNSDDNVVLHALQFLSAFVNLDVALPVRSEWDMKNRKCPDNGEDEDAEIIEQFKGELFIRLLGPRMIEDGDQNELTLWDFMMELMFLGSSIGRTNSVTNFDPSSTMLREAVEFRSLDEPPALLTRSARDDFFLLEAFLVLQLSLYIAQDASSPIDYDKCIASHLFHVQEYSDRITENVGQEQLKFVHRVVELHLKCLVVLASRRSQSSDISEAFHRVGVLTSILQRIQSLLPVEKKQITEDPGDIRDRSCSTPALPPLKLPHQNNEIMELHRAQSCIMPLSFSKAQSNGGGSLHFMASEHDLHALAIVLIASYIIVDSNLEIDEKVCPRISVPGADSTSPSDLLWSLQSHLSTVELDHRYFEALMIRLETSQSLVSAARASATRKLIRLLCPNSFDRYLYSTHPNEDYIAKGAFSTVFRQKPMLPRPETVAVKVVGHQSRSGELCPISGLFNEVIILSKLQGEVAATQLIDFGNHHDQENFKIVMEYCPCTLTEWRASFTRDNAETPFRSCVLMILRAFEDACHCLERIHQEGICHFDIKCDNLLSRCSSSELSRKLLKSDGDQKENLSGDDLDGWICFADFGESKLVDADRVPVRTFTFSSFSSAMPSSIASRKSAEKSISLSRTRGTEAIKSPEVLKIKGNEDVEVKVTLASDIWSLGCLLYELVTQELLFQNDDWAGLFAHLVVTNDQHVLRSDHKDKIFAALQPSCEEEVTLVTGIVDLCNKILTREPTRRPKLAKIMANVRKLVNDATELEVTATDQTFIIALYQSNGTVAHERSEDPQQVAMAQRFLTKAGSYQQLGSGEITVPTRFFWNFFIVADITKTMEGYTMTSKNSLTMNTCEAEYEAHFTHFFYLGWQETHSSHREIQARAGSQSRGLIDDLHEEFHRTCFLLNSSLRSRVDGDASQEANLVQHIVQFAPQYFPVLQRRLRDEAGCVAFAVLGKDAEDTKNLLGILVRMLMFFFQKTLAVTPFEAISFYARDCSRFFDYPDMEFMRLLHSSSVDDTATAHIVQCRCGSVVFTVESTALEDALSNQRCVCRREAGKHESNSIVTCPCFHPFPTKDNPLSPDFDDDDCPINTTFIHEGVEEKLVLPMESRSQRGHEIPWVVVDFLAVGRVDVSVFGAPSHLTKISDASASTRPASATREVQELLRGVRRHNKPTDSAEAPWDLFECEYCCLPICAVLDDKIALPLLTPHHKQQ